MDGRITPIHNQQAYNEPQEVTYNSYDDFKEHLIYSAMQQVSYFEAKRLVDDVNKMNNQTVLNGYELKRIRTHFVELDKNKSDRNENVKTKTEKTKTEKPKSHYPKGKQENQNVKSPKGKISNEISQIENTETKSWNIEIENAKLNLDKAKPYFDKEKRNPYDTVHNEYFKAYLDNDMDEKDNPYRDLQKSYMTLLSPNKQY